jgi:hypothetical protein
VTPVVAIYQIAETLERAPGVAGASSDAR